MLDTMMQISLSLVAFDKMSKVIKDAVRKSDDEFDKMQKKIKSTSDLLDKLGKNLVKAGAVLSAAGIGTAYKLGITDTISESLEMEHRLRELGNVGQLSAKQLEDMDKRLGLISKHTNQLRSEISEGLNVLVASGIDPEKALDYMNVIGRTATAAQAEIVDISKTAFALTDNLKVNVDDLGKTMDMLAQAGKEGRFELKDMAAAFPSLTAGASMLGMKGIPAVAQLGAALQVAMKGAGSAPEAANNLENFIQDITSPLAVNRFQELFGIDIKNFLNNVIAQNKDPIEEVVNLVKQVSGGDIFTVSEIFRNKTVLNFLKPMMQNLEEYQRIKQSALSADGIMDEDFNHMMDTSLEQIKLLKINMKELVFPHLNQPLKVFNDILQKINSNPAMQKGLFNTLIGTVGAGLVLTLLGSAVTLVGKLVSAYGSFLKYAKDLTPYLNDFAVKFFDSKGFYTTAHNLTYGRKILQSGNPLGLDMSNFSLKTGIFADIRRIDKNMRSGLINAFKELPSNISKSVISLKEWSVNSVKAVPSNIISGLSALKAGFFNIPGVIKNAITAFRAFSLTLLTSPLGWIALAITGAVFLIYKYWKPITGFFKGLWQGLKEGLQPVIPLFQRIGNALSPIIAPIKAVFNWFKNLLKPVEDTGGAAEKMGVKFGKAIADIIVKIVELVTKMFEFGKKISDMIANGILQGVGKIKNAISVVTQVIRDHLPHSPAKTGPLKDLNKVKIVETIASTIKPLPLISALNKSLSALSSPMKVKSFYSSPGSSSFTINYSPSVSVSASQSKDEFIALLKKHKDELVEIIRKEQQRYERLAY